jgi:hypothetical protein
MTVHDRKFSTCVDSRWQHLDAFKSKVLAEDRIDVCDWRCRGTLCEAGNRTLKPKPRQTIVKKVRDYSSRIEVALAKRSSKEPCWCASES